MTLDLIAVAAEGQIAAGRFVLRHVRRSDAGLFAMYAGDRRVAEATHSDDRNFLAWPHFPVNQGAVNRDASAQQRCSLIKLKPIRNFQSVIFVDHDL